MRKTYYFLLIVLLLTGCTFGENVNNNIDGNYDDNEYTFSTYQNPMIPLTKGGQEYWTEIADTSVVRGDYGFPYASYSYINDENENITIDLKPSYQIELDGPRFLLEK